MSLVNKMKVSRKQIKEMVRRAIRKSLNEQAGDVVSGEEGVGEEEGMLEAGSGVDRKDIMLDVLRDSGMSDADILSSLFQLVDDQVLRTALGQLVNQAQGK